MLPPVNSKSKGLKIRIRRIQADVHSPSILAELAVKRGGGPKENATATKTYTTVLSSAPLLDSEITQNFVEQPLSTEPPEKPKKNTERHCTKPRVFAGKTKKPTAPLGRPKARKLADKKFIPEPLTDADWARISATYWDNRRKEEEMLLASDSKRAAATGSIRMVEMVDDPDLPERTQQNSRAPGTKAVRRSARNRHV
jgi:hypothetical protein